MSKPSCFLEVEKSNLGRYGSLRTVPRDCANINRITVTLTSKFLNLA